MNGFFFLVYSCPALQDAIRAPSRKDEKKRRKRGNEFGITALAPPPPLPPQVGSAAAREFAIRHLQSQPTVQKLRPTSRSNNRPPPPVYAERRSDFKCDGCGGFSDFPPGFVSRHAVRYNRWEWSACKSLENTGSVSTWFFFAPLSPLKNGLE